MRRKEARGLALNPYIALEDGVKYRGAGGGRETSLEVVRKDEGVGQQEKRRGEAVMKENCQALVTD